MHGKPNVQMLHSVAQLPLDYNSWYCLVTTSAYQECNIYSAIIQYFGRTRALLSDSTNLTEDIAKAISTTAVGRLLK